MAIYYYKYSQSNDWDMDVGIIAEDSLELRDFIIELKEYFGDVLQIHDSYVVVEELKGNYTPKGIFRV